MTRDDFVERLIAILVAFQRLLPTGIELDLGSTDQAPTVVEVRMQHVAFGLWIAWALWEGEVAAWTNPDATLTWYGERAILEQAAERLRQLQRWLLEARR